MNEAETRSRPRRCGNVPERHEAVSSTGSIKQGLTSMIKSCKSGDYSTVSFDDNIAMRHRSVFVFASISPNVDHSCQHEWITERVGWGSSDVPQL